MLGGAPGLISARYAGMHGDSAANIVKLLGALDGIEDARRNAHFHCTIVLMKSADDQTPLIAAGRWRTICSAAVTALLLAGLSYAAQVVVVP